MPQLLFGASLEWPLMRGMNRRRLFRVLAAFLLSALLISLGEAGARLLIPAYKKYHPEASSGDDGQRILFEYHPSLGWIPKPNLDSWIDFPAARIRVTSNSEGFRDEEWESGDRRPHWVILGDSQVWGYNVRADQRFSDRLASKYPEIRFHNYGVSGYGTAQEYLLYLDFVRRRQPDGVLLLFGDNDRSNNASQITRAGYARPRYRIERDELVLENATVPDLDPSRIQIPWYRSHLWDALRYRRNRIVDRLTRRDPSHRIIRELAAAVRLDGSDFVVVVETKDAGILELCGRIEVPILELGSALERGRAERPIEFSEQEGRHWTPFGHERVAEAISAFVESILLRSRQRAESPVGSLRKDSRAIPGSWRSGPQSPGTGHNPTY